MILSIYLEEQHFTFDTSKVKDISIPLKFNGEQPNIFNTKRAESGAYEADGFVGDTRQGSGCNFEQLTLVPHCNGTHTECIGHITKNFQQNNAVVLRKTIPQIDLRFLD